MKDEDFQEFMRLEQLKLLQQQAKDLRRKAKFDLIIGIIVAILILMCVGPCVFI